MNTLNLENINNHAPYGVRHRENDCYSFYFETDFGLKYTISFMFENSFVQSGAFQFCINVEGAGRSPGDIKLRQTVFAIIEEFFAVNGKEAILYLCETGDEKEGLRNRLFIRWFNAYEHRHLDTKKRKPRWLPFPYSHLWGKDQRICHLDLMLGAFAAGPHARVRT